MCVQDGAIDVMEDIQPPLTIVLGTPLYCMSPYHERDGVLRRAKRYARKTGQEFRFDPSHGKGSHGRLYISDRFTTVQRGELSRAMLAAMIRQLGIKKEEF